MEEVDTLGRRGAWGFGGEVDVRNWSKKLFWALFGKILRIGRPWTNLVFPALQKAAKIRVIIYKIQSSFMDFMYKKQSILLKAKMDYNQL